MFFALLRGSGDRAMEDSAQRFRHHYPVAGLPDLDILLGTARGAHWAMLAALGAWRQHRQSEQAASVGWLFDLCIVRGHEGSRNSQRMIATRDPLPQPGRPHSPFTAVSLVIIGGPASEYASARKAAGGP